MQNLMRIMMGIPADKLNKRKVILGLSGGVDSTAAALLLKEKGFEVIGLFFDVLGNQIKAAEEAQKAAIDLGIPFIYKDVSEDFNRCVIDNFCDEYANGRTPNPCVRCNPLIKFKILIEEADKIGAYYVATGHYARVAFVDSINRFAIFKGKNLKKDQSYMLYGLGQQFLSRVFFPLGDVDSKEAVRSLVRVNRLANAEKKDSQEICFIKEDDYIGYIRGKGQHCLPGNYVDKNGEIIGKHNGLIHYTIGQRKGLGMTFGKPMFVTAIDSVNNTVVLGENEDLFVKSVYAKADPSLFAVSDIDQLVQGINVQAKIRYTAKESNAFVRLFQDTRAFDEKVIIETIFTEPQRAVTPGQSIVFYKDMMLLGGGIIERYNTKSKTLL
jgi:tRNA-uridine 2-sulfurtransferase